MNSSPCVPSCCSTPQVVNIPGGPGDDGVDGTSGIDAFTVTTQNFTLPDVGDSVGVSVAQSAWMVVGQNVVMTGPANFQVVSVPTTTSVTLMFLGYPGDLVPGTVIGAGATVSPGGIVGGGWSALSQKADQFVINSATMTNATDLQFLMSANTNYRIRGVVFFDTTAAGDFKYDFFAPSAPTLVRFLRYDAIAGAAPSPRAVDVVTPTTTTLAGAGTTGGVIKFDAIFQNGANASLFAFQFAQDTATNDSGAVVRAGSYFEISVN